MIHNEVYVCTNCNKKINIRYQVGYVKNIDAYIPCPHCTIIGKIKIQTDLDKPHFDIVYGENTRKVNAETIGEIMSADYHLELSADFPIKKSTNVTVFNSVSPFLRNVSLVSNFEENMPKIIADIIKYQNISLEKYEKLFTYYKNNRKDMLNSHLNKEFDIPKDEIDLKTVFELLEDNFSLFTKYKARTIVFSSSYRELKKASQNLKYEEIKKSIIKNNIIEKNLKKLATLMLDINKHFQMFYPLVITKYFKEDIDEEYFQTNYILTADVEKCYELYKDCYEIILSCIDPLIAIYGLNKYEDIVMVDKNKSILDVIESKYFNKTAKLRYALNKLCLNKKIPNLDLLDNSIRNPKGHSDYEYDIDEKNLLNAQGDVFTNQIKLAYYVYNLYDTLMFFYEYYLLLIEFIE
ncbi:MAG: hypothetical protein ACLRT4_04740 [Thomasclavelia sp.]